MSLHVKLLDIDHPLTFEECKLRQIEAHALIYLSKKRRFFFGHAKLQLNSANKETLYMYVNIKKTESHII